MAPRRISSLILLKIYIELNMWGLKKSFWHLQNLYIKYFDSAKKGNDFISINISFSDYNYYLFLFIYNIYFVFTWSPLTKRLVGFIWLAPSNLAVISSGNFAASTIVCSSLLSKSYKDTCGSKGWGWSTMTVP